ncbi:hypothetical protein NNJEOMEG_03408 [Fundidesulfovibrio magnetotacticus]|uniref:Dienelactone hydrolase n=1 Tax=Fundidesulfovibrio magnetotacticus TaxID=2730080 RepID=A0A6V8LSU0_9BACT|nr:hypothetical protein [Fundidesulfovibrio magnetotacticus]GFK95542.1 hypothetical protein NNJEOMEG_03408 [Fundidesulfovibrio magnetotacticus]
MTGRSALLPTLLLLWLLACGTARAHGVGLRILSCPATDGQPMQAAVFYLAQAPADGFTSFGPVRAAAVREAPPLPGRRPLVGLSHGNAGSMLSHHDTASALARAGFLVVCPMHPGDNFRDQSRLGSPALFLNRPGEVSAALDAVMRDPLFASLADPERLGAAGFSMGGYDVLVLAGARPDFQLADAYCERPGALGFCANRRAIAATELPPGGLADPRLRAVAAMAPMDAFFSGRSLSTLGCPVLLFAAERDEAVRPAGELERLLPSFPPGTRLHAVAGAGHFVFLAPCGPEQAKAVPRLCQDPEGVDRQAVHEALHAELIDFFTRHLGAPEPTP